MSFWNALGIVLSVALFVGAVNSHETSLPTVYAKSVLKTLSDESQSSQIHFTQMFNGVQLHCDVQNLPPGLYTIEIPETTRLGEIQVEEAGSATFEVLARGQILADLIGQTVVLNKIDPVNHRKYSSAFDSQNAISGVIKIIDPTAPHAYLHRCSTN